ncbi:hypothetical protein [Kordiimonas sp.]|uniref:hypothetical protein n=1 Tax=Kordiimonas sp. TaxID=1970157 RepID=UPI003A8F4E7F
MIDALQTLTAITDPAANVAIIAGAVWLIRHHIKLATHDVRLENLERKVFAK